MLGRILRIAGADLAIDLGAANTIIGVVGRGVVLNEPSVVAVDAETRRILSRGMAVGRLARQMQGRTPETIAVIQPLASGVIADYQMCEAMLRCFMRKAGGTGRMWSPRVMIGVPNRITAVEKRAAFNSAFAPAPGRCSCCPRPRPRPSGRDCPSWSRWPA